MIHPRAFRQQPTHFAAAAIAAALLASGCTAPLSGNGEAGATTSGAGKAVGQELRDAKYSWMALYLPWQESGFDLLRKYHTKEAEDAPLPPERLKDCTLYCTLGSNWDRVYATLRIDPTGAAVAAYQDYTSRRYFQRSFRLTPAQTQMLQRCLRENNIGALAESYVDLKTQEGTQGGITLVLGGQTRRTYCSNAWPAPAQALFTLLNNEVLRFRPGAGASGFAPVQQTILQTDPETTLAVRGLVRGAKKSMPSGEKSRGN